MARKPKPDPSPSARAEAILAAMFAQPGVTHIIVMHDGECPAGQTGRDADCRCMPDLLIAQPPVKGRQS